MLRRLTDWYENHRQWRRNLAAAGPGHVAVHDPRSMRWRCAGCKRPWCCHVHPNPCHPRPTDIRTTTQESGHAE
jgi:hypothetical protein